MKKPLNSGFFFVDFKGFDWNRIIDELIAWQGLVFV